MSFKCLKNCGKCCRGVTVTPEFFSKHKPNVPYRINKRGHYVHKDAEICVWLNKFGECTIYNSRPQTCKDFGTHEKAKTLDGYKCAFKNPDGTGRTREETTRLLRIIMPTLGKTRFITDSEIKRVWSDV